MVEVAGGDPANGPCPMLFRGIALAVLCAALCAGSGLADVGGTSPSPQLVAASPSAEPESTGAPKKKPKKEEKSEEAGSSGGSSSRSGGGGGGGGGGSGEGPESGGGGGGGSGGSMNAALKIHSLAREFYVLGDGDKDLNPVLTLGVAAELNKVFERTAAQPALWTIPEPSWSLEDFAGRCSNDPNSVGAVVITYYSGNATHFYLLWQSETTSTVLYAQLITCGQSPDGVTYKAQPTLVGVVSDLPGADGTPWVVRRSQVSIPLLSLAAVGAFLSSGKSTSKTSQISLATVTGSLFTGAGSRDIPGYSDPLRLRYSAKHVGDDLYVGMRDGICAGVPADPASAPGFEPRAQLCLALGLAPSQAPPPSVPGPQPAH